MRLKKVNKRTWIIIGIIIVIVAGFGVTQVLGNRGPSTEEIAKQRDIVSVAVGGWRIKQDARVWNQANKIKEYKQQLINYYSPQTGALAEQQRILDAMTADNPMPDYRLKGEVSNESFQQRVVNFRVDKITPLKMDIKKDSATIQATIDFYTRFRTEGQAYGTFGKNTYEWKLKKEGKTWKIQEEKLLNKADNAAQQQ